MLETPGAGDILRIDRIGARQIVLLVLGVLVLFADGFDAQMAGLVASTMAAEWHVPTAAFARVFALNVTGLMIGSMVLSVLGDRFGRKPVIVACVLIFGLTSLAAAATTSVGQLAFVRLLSGLALGGAMPCMIAATSDYFPVRYRTRLAVLLTTAWSLGIAGCAFATALLIHQHGWRSIYLLGAVLPLLLTPAIMLLLPESPAFLLRRGRTEELRNVLARIAPGADWQVPAALPRAQRSPVAGLFADNLAGVTISLWVAYFAAGATIYFFLNWLPIFVASAGYSPAQAASVTSLYQLGGLFGGLGISVLIDKGGARALALSTAAAAVIVFLMATTVHSLAALTAAVALAGAAIVGSQNSANAYTGSRLYPADIRATGLGWALGWVRLSGVLAGSLGGGFLMTLGVGPAATLRLVALPEIIASLGFLGVHLALARGARTR